MSKAARIWQGIRFAAVGSVSQGLGLFNREWGRQYLVREISRIPGLPAKAAQVLELKYARPGWKLNVGEALPVEWAKERILASSPQLAEQILEISEEGMAASLGQVHWARLKSGREVAVKVQFPEAAEQLKDQLDLLLSAMDLVPASRKYGLDVEAYRSFLREFFLREVDYDLEARGQTLFREAWLPLGGVLVPEIFPDLCGPGILVQSFEAAKWLDSLVAAPEPVREAAAKQLARVVLVGSFHLGLIHTDLHPRNWGYNEEKRQIVLYDYGATLRLDEGMREALHNFFFSGDESPGGCMTRLGDLGFELTKLSYIAQQLPEVMDLLTEPFQQKDGWDPSSWNLSERLDALLGGDRWWFRVAGPPWFLFLMRGWFGAVEAIARLQVKVDLRRILAEEAGIDPGAAASGSASGPSSAAAPSEAARPGLGPVLRVQVKEGSVVVVDLELPARVVEDLEDVIPEQVLERLQAQGVDLPALKRRALESGLAPQELFQTSYEKRTCRVWIQ